jgi:hypothetical protein
VPPCWLLQVSLHHSHEIFGRVATAPCNLSCEYYCRRTPVKYAILPPRSSGRFLYCLNSNLSHTCSTDSVFDFEFAMGRTESIPTTIWRDYHVPAKCITSPHSLLKAMDDLAGPGNYRIEVGLVFVRHCKLSMLTSIR